MCSKEILINSDQSFPGAYTPLTMEGNIVVDGILVSCYAFCDHDSAHIGMLPIQLFPILTKWIFGEDNGSSIYANIAGDIGGWMLLADFFRNKVICINKHKVRLRKIFKRDIVYFKLFEQFFINWVCGLSIIFCHFDKY